MGSIIDQNSNSASVDSWALVSGTTVSNTIVANLSFIETIQDDYDYLVDVTFGENASNCEPGSTYDPVNDVFSSPPVDWVAVLENDLDRVHSDLLQCLTDAAQASSGDLSSAISMATTDVSPSFSTNESDLWSAICTWLSNGG